MLHSPPAPAEPRPSPWAAALTLVRAMAAARSQGRRVAVVDTSGGLGNQLFHYAFGRHLAARGFDVLHEIRRLRPQADPAGRTYQLQPLAPRTIALPENRLWRGALLRACRLQLGGEPGPHAFVDVGRAGTRHRLFAGYWQHPRYGSESRAEIQSVLARSQVDHPLLERPGIVVGARRGDYVSQAPIRATHGVLAPDYYLAALGAAPADLPVYLFSDDTAWAEGVLRPFLAARQARPVQVVADGFDDWQTLSLMSRGWFHVMANSTFHWWAAALSTSSRGGVAPEPWLRSVPGRGEILLPQWRTAAAVFE